MFTEPPTPRAVKRILFDHTFKLSAETDHLLLISPFQPYFYTMKSGGGVVGNILPTNALSSFTTYRVVCLKLRFKQIGIDSSDSNLNSQVDIAIIPPVGTVDYILANFLSIQVAGGDRLTMIDGRDGVMACLIGSMTYPLIHTDLMTFNPNLTTAGGNQPVDVDIPAYSQVLGVPSGDDPVLITGEGRSQELPSESPLYLPMEGTQLSRGAVLAEVYTAPRVAIRVSAPPAEVTFKLYCDVVVEGQVKPDQLLNIPQVAPPSFFDFGKLERAFTNVIPRVWPMKDSATLFPGLGFPMGPSEGYHAGMGPVEVDVGKDNSIQATSPYTAYAAQKLPFQVGNLLFKPKGNQMIDLSPNIPPFLEEAIAFRPILYGDLDSSNAHNRLGVDTSKELPDITYQYFPIVDQDGPHVALVVVDHGVAEGTIKKFEFVGVDGKKFQLSVGYRANDTMDEAEFVEVLTQTLLFLYSMAYHNTSSIQCTVRLFSPVAFKGKSYQLALHAALVGACSGQFLTGCYKLSQAGPIALPMEEDVIKAKAALASYAAPLIVLAEGLPDGMLINTHSGTIPDYMNGLVVPSGNAGTCFIYILSPPRMRGITTTPVNQYRDRINSRIIRDISDLRRYIALALIKNPNKIKDLASGGHLGIKDFMRANPNRFTTFLTHTKSKMSALANEFYDEHPDLLDEVAHFHVNDILFVDPYVFKGHLRKYAGAYRHSTSTKFLQEETEKKNTLRNITSNDYDALLKDKVEKLSPNMLAKEIKSVIPKEPKIVNVAYQERVAKMLEGFDALLATIKNFADKYQGKKQVLLSAQGGGDFLANCGIPTKVTASAPLDQITNVLQYLNYMIASVGPAGGIVAAKLSRWGFRKNEPVIRLAHLQNLENFLSKNPIPKLDIQDAEIANEMENSKLLDTQVRIQAGEINAIDIKNELPNRPPKIPNPQYQTNMISQMGLQEKNLGGQAQDDYINQLLSEP